MVRRKAAGVAVVLPAAMLEEQRESVARMSTSRHPDIASGYYVAEMRERVAELEEGRTAGPFPAWKVAKILTELGLYPENFATYVPGGYYIEPDGRYFAGPDTIDRGTSP
jgi:hypothetical protein